MVKVIKYKPSGYVFLFSDIVPSQRGLQLRCNYFTPKAHQFLIKQLPSKVFSADIAQI
jgi:hypothetical protein